MERLEPFTTQSWFLNNHEPFETIVGKGENVGTQHFLLFQHCFHLMTNTVPVKNVSIHLVSLQKVNRLRDRPTRAIDFDH